MYILLVNKTFKTLKAIIQQKRNTVMQKSFFNHKLTLLCSCKIIYKFICILMLCLEITALQTQTSQESVFWKCNTMPHGPANT
uniref:Uncharacterized protein n=1 Tax=Anguilla anguilla TaxID=7936 RepID=A0A0E9WWT4_ANGAN